MKTKKQCYVVTVTLNSFYHVRSATVHFRSNGFIAEKMVHAKNRDRAIYLALQWYWKHMTDKTGPVHKVLTVDDPSGEVAYTTDFLCALRKNNYLSDDVAERVISDSEGVLKRNVSNGTPYHPPNTLARVKRRRKLLHWIAPSIYRDSNGTLFFRMTVCSQVSRKSMCIRRRRVRMARLQAKDIPSAARELVTSGLFESHLRQMAYFKDNGLRSLIKRHVSKHYTIPIVA